MNSGLVIHSVFHSSGRCKPNLSTKVLEFNANIDFSFKWQSQFNFFWGAEVEVVYLHNKKSLFLSWTKCIIKWFNLHSILKEEMGQIHFLNIIQCLTAQFLGTGTPWEFFAFPSCYFYHLNSSRLFGSFIKQHLAMLYGYSISLICHHKSITPIL